MRNEKFQVVVTPDQLLSPDKIPPFYPQPSYFFTLLKTCITRIFTKRYTTLPLQNSPCNLDYPIYQPFVHPHVLKNENKF